ncbi:MAG TPA: alanine racemase [Pelolinea sp.]|nr:alanine racemase [Pelolinea sp.]
MDNEKFPQIIVPTALVNKKQAKNNIQKMADKTASQGIRFRPHFKTHQSALIGEWFRDAGVICITVSSVRMAAYFAENGWEDILIAFPVNLRELEKINELSRKVKLSLLVESIEAVEKLKESVQTTMDLWVKIDTGMHRAGIAWEDKKKVEELCLAIEQNKELYLAGLLTHAGQTYHAASHEKIIRLYQESNRQMIELQDSMSNQLKRKIEISVGDTPGCWLCDNLGAVDEIRPGNFLFFDAMMMDLGVCQPEDIAVAVACPVVAKHPERSEVVIYGGAVHLSKEYLLQSRQPIYGYAVFVNGCSWRFPGRENYVVSLSQEHGVVRLSAEEFQRIDTGDLLMILPVHSCLAVDTLGSLMDLEGNHIKTMRTC